MKLILWLLLLLFISCEEASDRDHGHYDLEIGTREIGASAGVIPIVIEGANGGLWSGEITCGEDFASFDQAVSVTSFERVVSEYELLNRVYLYLDANTQGASREVQISISLPSHRDTTLRIVQHGMSIDEKPDSVASAYHWPELPEYSTEGEASVVAHFTMLNGARLRNYTLCYDHINLAARWVAYPYHEIYSGGVGRCETWRFDPQIPEYEQHSIFYPYNGAWDRGHQLPSDDRQASEEMNQQTFYFSNIAPQSPELNQQVWEKIEEKVREQVCPDTLYVVTGADFSRFAGVAIDDRGRMCPVPYGYFKAILRTRTGDSGKAIAECTPDELITLAFWIENKPATAFPKPIPVCELEKRIGLTLFADLPVEVKSACDAGLWSL